MNKEALRNWVKKPEAANLPVEVEDVQARIRRLETEQWELRKSNGIIRSTTALFGKAEFERLQKGSLPSSTKTRNGGGRTDLSGPTTGRGHQHRVIDVVRLQEPSGRRSNLARRGAQRKDHGYPFSLPQQSLRHPQDPRRAHNGLRPCGSRYSRETVQ